MLFRALNLQDLLACLGAGTVLELNHYPSVHGGQGKWGLRETKDIIVLWV